MNNQGTSGYMHKGLLQPHKTGKLRAPAPQSEAALVRGPEAGEAEEEVTGQARQRVRAG